MRFNLDTASLDKVRWGLGGFCLVAAWLFPFYSVVSRDVLQQLFALGMFGLAALLLGMSAIARLPLIVLVLSMVAMALSPNAYLGGHIAGLAGLLLAGMAAHVGARAYRQPTGLPWLLIAIVIAAFCNGAEGLLQWFGLVSDLSPWVIEPERRGVAYGAFRQPNLFATFVCVGVVCAMWLVEIRRLTEIMAWFLLVVLVFAVAASGSRSGALGLVALALAGLIWRKQQSAAVTRLMVGQLFVFALATLVLPIAAKGHGFDFVSGAARVASATQDARIVVWRNAVDLILERPWAGWGWLELGYGHYVTVFQHRFGELLGHTHNFFLQIAVEFGMPAAFALLSATIWLLFRGRPWQARLVPSVSASDTDHSKDESQGTNVFPDRSYSTSISASPSRQFAWSILLLIGIHSMLELPLWYPGFLFLGGLAVGFLMPAPMLVSHHGSYSRWSARLAALCALGLIALAVVAWLQFAKVEQIAKAPFGDRAAQRAAVAAASDAWLFRGHVDFAAMGLVDVTAQNALDVRQRAEKLLHFSAEPQVILPLLASLKLLGDTSAMQFHAERFCRAFPAAYARWRQGAGGEAIEVAPVRLPQQSCDQVKP